MLKYFAPLIFSFTSFSQENIETPIDVDPLNGSMVDVIGEHKYVSLKDNKVFDIEIIVFAYLNPLPNYETFTNKAIFDDSQALKLEFKPEDLPYIYEEPQEDAETVENSENSKLDLTNNLPENKKPEFTVPIGDQEEDMQVLAWFEHQQDFYKLVPVWERLALQQNIVPILHKAWRQTETPFDNPTYVKMSNVLSDQPEVLLSSDEKGVLITSDSIPESNPFEIHNQLSDVNSQPETIPNYIENTVSEINSVANNFYALQKLMVMEEKYFEEFNSMETKPMLYSDYTVTGMVALSKGRFMHFGHKINLMRLFQDIEHENEIKNMVFSLIERKELDTDELHYFDSPWFGSIVKITEYKGEPHEDTEETIE